MAEKPAEQDDLTGRQMTVTRVVDAPRELVFDVFTDPAHVSNWWGPNGFSITTDEMKVRPGGVWRFVMHGPDGTDYSNFIQYKEIVRPERIVFGHGDNEESKSCHWHTTVTFEPVGRKTRVTLILLFPTAEQRDAVATASAIEGGEQTLERFETEVVFAATRARGETPFTIKRVFDAPREVVWAAHSDAKALAQWWGPKGWAVRVEKLAFQPGGMFHYVMTSKVAADMWGRFIYRELVAPRRIVFVSSFSNPEADLARSPFPMDWPLAVLNVVTLDDEAGRTRLTLTATPLEATPEQCLVFSQMFMSMTQGFGGTYDQLAEFLVHA
ncbi:MAG: SRPBCC domain-containing protein [Hyphomicrobium sp.]|nr:SRPBCC domain-containing protein [Hyphomicrobium sp.]